MLKQSILKYALQNAIKFEGNASKGAIIGKLIQEDPGIKSKLKEIAPEIQKTIEDIKKLTKEQQLTKLKEIAPELLEEKKQEKKELKELKDTENFKVRIAPSPSGALHIGHSYGLAINYLYKKEYNGKLVLRIEDTNPENIYKDAYTLIEKDAQWLTNNEIDEIIIQSERLGIYYDHAEKLIQKEKAYVCTCDPDEFRKLKAEAKACPCRNLKDQNERFQKMFSEYKPGQAVLRMKTNIKDKNPAMRDFPIMRINDHTHPKTDQRVWPLMNFSVAIDDHELNITHVLNGKDHTDNAKKQQIIFEAFNWKILNYQHWGRINFEGMKISSTETRIAIEEKKYEGWNDVRLPFLPALRRRGYQPEALQKFASSIGLSLTDKTVDKEEFFKSINSFNKEIVDPISSRYFFIENPKKIIIEGAKEQDIELDLHPDNKKGGRIFKTNNIFYITKDDFNKIKEDELIRLMDCLNFKKENNKFIFHSHDYEEFKKQGKQIIHWLPEDFIETDILMPNNEIIKGYGETSMKNIKKDEIVQLERFGFCRSEKDKFIFTHK